MTAYDVDGKVLKVGDWAKVVKDHLGRWLDTPSCTRKIIEVRQKYSHYEVVMRLRYEGDPPGYGRVPQHQEKVTYQDMKAKREPRGFAAFVKRIEK